jgi:hypothetical protein
LEQIGQSDWKQVTPEHVLDTWPSQLDELKCKSETSCRLLVSKNRVIGGHCECCEAFEFDSDPRAEGPRNMSLGNIIIHYSAAKRPGVVDAARKLARAAGLPEAKIATVGSDLVQRYEWSDTVKEIRQSYIAEMQITKLSTHWELYFSLSASEF